MFLTGEKKIIQNKLNFAIQKHIAFYRKEYDENHCRYGLHIYSGNRANLYNVIQTFLSNFFNFFLNRNCYFVTQIIIYTIALEGKLNQNPEFNYSIETPMLYKRNRLFWRQAQYPSSSMEVHFIILTLFGMIKTQVQMWGGE